MKLDEMVSLTTDQLVDEFIKSAKERGVAILDSDNVRANRMFDKMQAVDRTLKSRGHDSRSALLPLLDDDDRFVRYFCRKVSAGAGSRSRALRHRGNRRI